VIGSRAAVTAAGTLFLVAAAVLCLAGPAQGQPAVTDQKLKFHQSRVAADPDDPLALNRLAGAYVQKARESGDVAYYGLAETAARRSLGLLPRGAPAAAATTIVALVHLARHEFAEALARAREAADLDPGDATPHAVAGDALIELGEYERAAEAYARLSDLQGARSPQSRLAYLQFLRGDSPGAIARMRAAVQAVRAAGPRGEPVAWAHAQLGDLLFQTGDLRGADAAFAEALAAAPGYHRALAGTARVRAAQQRYQDAAALYQKALAVIPLPEYAAALGDVATRLGRPAEASKHYALVEYIGRLSALNQAVYNRELALFYADHDRKLPEALELARRELQVRRDIYTYDLLAWALYKNGRAREALEPLAEALRLGTRDARLLFHAGMIHHALGDTAAARGYLEQALALHPLFDPLQAGLASRTLEQIRPRRSGQAPRP
jgi:tetratricopeptide (TPR) repeat protein